MKELEDELINLSRVLDRYNFTKEEQIKFINGGEIVFKFERHPKLVDTARLSCFDFIKLIEFCENAEISFDPKAVLKKLRVSWSDNEYEPLITMFKQQQEEKQKQMTKSSAK